MARPTLLRHRKFLRLVHVLGIPPAHAYGHLCMLWESCYEAGEDLLGDGLEVELAAGWVGTAGALTSALVAVGFVDVGDEGRHFAHDLWDHAPDYVAKRAKREAERRAKGETLSSLRRSAAEERWQRARMQTDASGGQLQPLAMQTDAKVCTPAPTPAPAPAPALPEPEVSPAPPATTKGRGCGKAKKPDAEIPGELLAAIPDFPALWTRRLDAAGEKNRRPGPTGQEEQLELLRAGLATRGAADVVALVKMATSRSWQGMEWAWMDRDRAAGNGRGQHRVEDEYNIFRQTPEDLEVIRRREEAALAARTPQ